MTLLVAALLFVTAVAAAAIALLVMQRAHLNYLRSLLAGALEHGRRVERVTSGMSELAPERTKPDNCPPATDLRIREAIGMWGGAESQHQKRQDVAGWRRDGKDWEWIAAELESEVAAAMADE